MHDTLHTWARDYGVPAVAVLDLLNRLGIGYEPIRPEDIPPTATEAAVSQRVRFAAAEAGLIYWRNNVGAMMDDNGNMVRFGLCNDTAALNKRFKSSDLIGINDEPITSAMIGLPRGQLMAREVKKADWVYTGTDREVAQLAFGQLVISKGGDFKFTTGGI